MVVVPRAMLCGALVLLALAVPTAVGQAPAPSGADNTLWLHFDGASPRNYWMSTAQADPEHSGNTAGYNALGFAIGDEVGVAGWDLPLRPALAAPVTLDPSGVVASTIYIGGGSNVGRVTVTSELRLGDTVVATATSGAVVYANSLQKVELTATPTVAALDPAAGELVWRILAEGAGSQVVLGATGETWTNLVLPALGGGSAGPTYQPLNGTTATVQAAFANATDGVFVHNWTASAGILQLDAFANGTGNATLAIVDAANATVFNGTLLQAVHQEVNGTVGNWTLTVTLAAFQGNLTLTLGPKALDTQSVGNGTVSGSGTTTTGATQGNATEDADEETADAPLPLVIPAAAVAVALWARRRRA